MTAKMIYTFFPLKIMYKDLQDIPLANLQLELKEPFSQLPIRMLHAAQHSVSCMCTQSGIS